MNFTNEVYNLETKSYTHWHLISHVLRSYDVNKEGIMNIMEYKVDSNANIANFLLL